MAAGKLPAPGTEYGPCEDDECGHTDCNLTRGQAAAPCDICGKPIGYETRFYVLDNGELVHADCHETRLREQDTAAAVVTGGGPGSYLGDPD